MALLTALDVRRIIEDGGLRISPFQFQEERTPPASIDLRLSAKIIRYRFRSDTSNVDEYLLGEELDESEAIAEDIKAETYTLKPGRGAVFVLYEELSLPLSLAGIVLPRSSLTRLGVSLQPAYLNPGYQGFCPILLTNNSDFRVTIPFRDGKGPRVAQVLFLELTSHPHRGYGQGEEEKYQYDEGFPARFYQDFDIKELLKPFKKALDEI